MSDRRFAGSRIVPACSLVALLLALAPPCSYGQQLLVSSARVDTAAGELVVTGAPLAAGLRVFLGFTELSVVSVSGNTARATMPATPPTPGTYGVIVLQPSTGKVALFSVAIGPTAILLDGLSAPIPYEATTQRYIVEAPAAVVGRVIPLDTSLLERLCKDKDGCDVTLAMINWDAGGQPGNVASRSFRLFLSETSGWWRVSNFDTSGLDSDGVAHEYWVFDCGLTDAETYLGSPNGRTDAGFGFGLLDWIGGTYNDATTYCRVVIDD